MEYILALGIAAIIALLVMIYSKQQTAVTKQQGMEDLRQSLQQQMDSLRTQVQSSLSDNAQLIGQRLDSTTKLMGDVRTQLRQVEQASHQVHELAKDISSLQEILRAPKLRGNLGELFLQELLAQILPPSCFTLSHTFKSGEKVDAVIRLGDKILPVDSKFPLDDFRRVMQAQTSDGKCAARKEFDKSVKRCIDSIAQKYILPDEQTFDFALMYIPAENVYYETIVRDEDLGAERSLINHALERRVIPISPSIFYAYLQVIIMGLKGMQVEQNAKEILARIARLREDFRKFGEDFDKLGRHLTNARGSYENAGKRLNNFGEKLGGLDTDAVVDKELADDSKIMLS